MRIACIGLGAMGRPMAERLLAANHAVTAYDVNPEPVRALAGLGAIAAASPAEAAAGSRVALLIPFDYAQVEACVLGPGGILETAEPGTILLVMATVAPAAVRQLAERVAPYALRVVDSPLTGGITGAAGGTLTAIVGGDAADVEACAPVFQPLCRKVAHVGPLGAGLTVKALNQMVYAAHLAATCEMAALAARAGVDLSTALDVLRSGVCDSWVLRNRAPALEDGSHRTGARTALLRKDLAIVQALAHQAGQPVPLTAAAAQMLEWSASMGYGDLDDAHMALALQGIARHTPPE